MAAWRLCGLDARHTAAAVDADRHVAVDGGAAHDAVLIAVIVDRVVLRRAVVPDRDVAGLPAPAHGVFGRGDVRLEQVEQLLAVIFRQADEALHEIAEHQRALAGFRMDAHDRMLGLVDRSGEDLVEMLSIGLGGARLHRVVVGVAVDGPELVGEPLQRRRQIEIGRGRIRPDGVAAERRDHDAAQHRYLRIGVDEGDVGVPLVGASATPAGIELQDRRRALDRADGRMRHQLAEPDGEAFLLGVVEMVLVAKEDDLVLEQHLVDGADRLVGQIARQLDVPDLGAEPRRTLDDIGARDDVIDGCRLGHDRASLTAIPCDEAPPCADRRNDGGDKRNHFRLRALLRRNVLRQTAGVRNIDHRDPIWSMMNALALRPAIVKAISRQSMKRNQLCFRRRATNASPPMPTLKHLQ